MPAVASIRELHTDEKALIEERNRLVHSLVWFDPTHRDENGSQWGLFHPRSRQDIDMPTLGEMNNLAQRMQALAARALGVVQEAAQQHGEDSPRTTEAPDA